MKRFFVDECDISNGKIKIVGDEFFHLNKVLRTQVGEKIICTAGDEFDYICELTKIEKNQAEAIILEKSENLSNPKIVLEVFQGLPKGEKTEFIVQKITELGASGLTFFESDFTVAKTFGISKMERLKKIAKEACKQCGRSQPLKLNNVIKFKEIEKFLTECDIILFLNENANPEQTFENLIKNIKKSKKIALIIGAEGGFSNNEIAFINSLNLKILFNISLGQRILRTETACVGAVSFISFLTNN